MNHSSEMTYEKIQTVMELVTRYEHLSPDRILLGSSSIPQELRPDVVRQLSYRSKMLIKYPSFMERGIYLPAGITYEQASSEATALYKQTYVKEAERLTDGTGGLGIDFVAMASKALSATYIEREELFVEAARYNLPHLLQKYKGLTFSILRADMTDCLEMIIERGTTLLYFDPARRSEEGQRTYALEDIIPNPMEICARLKELDYKGRILIKLSPMIDITNTLRQMPMLSHIEIVMSQGEVKELLGYIEDLEEEKSEEKIPIKVTSLSIEGKLQHTFAGSLREERASKPSLAEKVGQYLYVPHAGAFKSGLYNTIAERWNVQVLHPNSHLYTSDNLCQNFPGKVYQVAEVLPFSAGMLKRLRKSIPKANFSARNFPLNPEQFYAKSRIKSGDEVRLFGTTIYDETLIILRVLLVEH